MPRLLFEKMGNAVWISHLDLMRVFQRAFRRAGIAIYHSQGYSPRAHVSMALPLPVGTESQCELLDFAFAEGAQLPLESLPARLNAVLPAGIRVLSAWEGGKKLKELTYLDASLTLQYDHGLPAGAGEKILAFFQSGQPVIVPKRTKTGQTQLDIQPMIQAVSILGCWETTLQLQCRVCAQNPSLNPMLLPEALRLHRPELAPDFAKARRLEILDSSGAQFR
ncbi:MAG TPA: DUF2344 domain-containing protein [Candidatus Faecousia faecigallinarum]|nr:DUF2344 domain-containing protein [Candidatus Faecousia faecigallinarum]